MLDDRTTTPDPQTAPFVTWGYEDNLTGWTALLGTRIGGPTGLFMPPRRRATHWPSSDLPEVGQLDIFRDEDLTYARRLSDAGVDVEFHLHPGVPHEFDTFAWDTDVARRAVADRLRALSSL